MFDISEYEHHTCALLSPRGVLDTATAHLLNDKLQRHLGRRTPVLVHCRHLILRDLGALDLLTDTATRARAAGTDLRLIGLRLAVNRWLHQPG